MHGSYTNKLTELDDHQHLIVVDFTTWSLFWKLDSHLQRLCQCNHDESSCFVKDTAVCEF